MPSILCNQWGRQEKTDGVIQGHRIKYIYIYTHTANWAVCTDSNNCDSAFKCLTLQP